MQNILFKKKLTCWLAFFFQEDIFLIERFGRTSFFSKSGLYKHAQNRHQVNTTSNVLHAFLRTRGAESEWVVARSRGNKPGAGIGADQTASIPTMERFVWICDISCLFRGKTCMHFLAIICADIIFKCCRYTHMRINRGRGEMAFKGGSKRTKRDHAPKRPKKCTKSTYFSI